MNDAVEVEGLEKAFSSPAGPRRALAGATFTVRRGEVFGVLGPNGGGKTTLFRILSTSLRPGGGRARVFGADVEGDPAAVRRKIGVVFQNPSLDGKLTVAENLLHQGRLYGLSGAPLRLRMAEVLERLGLADRAKDFVETLSGGLRRRAEIAKGLLHRPDLLLMDEPSTGLDPGARADLWAYLRELKAEGVTVLLTTHLMEEADRCDRLAIISRGLCVALGSPPELKARIGADVILVRAGDPEALRGGIKERFNLPAALMEDGVVRLEKSQGASFIPQLVEAFPGLIDSVTVGKPTLEDVFTHETGHRFWRENGRAE